MNKSYVVDEDGNRLGVIVPIEDYRKLMEDLEELESIRAFDAAKQSGDKAQHARSSKPVPKLFRSMRDEGGLTQRELNDRLGRPQS